MSDNVEIIPGQQTQLLDELQGLLEKQIELVYRGNSSGGRFGVLSNQAYSLVEKIAQTGILNRAEFKNQRECLKKLYEDLCLAVTAQKTQTAEQLSQLRRARKTIKTYRSNI